MNEDRVRKAWADIGHGHGTDEDMEIVREYEKKQKADGWIALAKIALFVLIAAAALKYIFS